jgi:GNAT superfamily N-acetyltransferase
MTYINVSVQADDELFDPCYELLFREFGTLELESATVMRSRLRPSGRAHPRSVLIGRFAVANDLPDWSRPVGVTARDYIPMMGGEAVAALGHLVTDDHRRGAGHGTALVAGFERAVIAEAVLRRERLALLVHDSRPTASAFWARQGYRWVAGSRYRQPAMSVDSTTGVAPHTPVPELLMIKTPEGACPDLMRTDLVSQAVRSIYHHWYAPEPDAYAPAVRAALTAELWGGLFAEFVQSLPESVCRLTAPPTRPPALRVA